MDYERFQATAIFSKDLRSIQPSEMWFYLRFLGVTTTWGTPVPLRAAQDCIQPRNKPQLQLHTACHPTKKPPKPEHRNPLPAQGEICVDLLR